MALQIDIAANTRQAQGEVKDLGTSLEDVASSLDEMAREAQRGGNKTESALKDTGRETERLEKKFKDLADGAKKQGRAGADVGDGYKKGFKEASEGAEDFKQEAQQSAKETAASFDGSAESIVDMFQEVAANALGGFGPAGVAAGLAAAGGIGLAVAGFEAVGEAQAAADKAAGEWADKFIESGQRVATTAQQTAMMIDIATDPEKYKEAKDAAESWGVGTETAMLAMSGNSVALKVVKDSVADLAQQAREAEAAALGMSTEMGGVGVAAIPVVRQADEAASKLDRLTGAMDEGASRAKVTSDGLLRLAESAEGATMQVDELGNKVVSIDGRAEIFIDAKTGQASQNLDRFQGDLDELPKTREIDVRMKLDDSAVRNYRPPVVYVQGQVNMTRLKQVG